MSILSSYFGTKRGEGDSSNTVASSSVSRSSDGPDIRSVNPDF